MEVKRLRKALNFVFCSINYYFSQDGEVNKKNWNHLLGTDAKSAQCGAINSIWEWDRDGLRV